MNNLLLDLSGNWSFRLDDVKEGIRKEYFKEDFDDTICLPATTATAHKGEKNTAKDTGYLTEVYPFEGYAWFSRVIEIPQELIGEPALLTLERTRISYVWVDDRFVGSQDSFSCAHSYDLTEYLTKTCHKLTVMVSNTDYKTGGGHMTSPDTQTNWNGILGEISLRIDRAARIQDLQVFPSAEKRKLEICFTTICCKNVSDATAEMTCRLMEMAVNAKDTIGCSDDKAAAKTAANVGNASDAEDMADAGSTLVSASTKITLSPGENPFTWEVAIPEENPIMLWNEYTPTLYEVTVTIKGAQKASENPPVMEKAPESGDRDVLAQAMSESGDAKILAQTAQNTKILARAKTVIGFRDLHTEGRNFYLNDLPVMLRGKHDGMIFPLTGHAPMEKAQWLRIFGVAKDYGVNHYRFHTCCPPEAAFQAADEMGLYLAPELPFWGTVAGEEETQKEREGREYLLEEGFRILRMFGNHPSFLIFSLGNELWGNSQVLNEILGKYKAADGRHWYVQGSNNFQFSPVILENDDFFSGVRFSKERLFRGSYAMCDAPQGHVQVREPENCYNYDDMICPPQTDNTDSSGDNDSTKGEVEIQYQTGVKKVKVEKSEELIPEVPVVSHEIGQYCIYPDYSEISKYTGVLQPENLKIFRQRLSDGGLLHMAERFFTASGHLAVDCYKRELETAFRSKELAGFQLLDLQDFTGQGTALVGILNAFMENKGLVSAKTWRQFCSDQVVMLSFPTFVYTVGGASALSRGGEDGFTDERGSFSCGEDGSAAGHNSFSYEVLVCNMRPAAPVPVRISVTLTQRKSGKIVAEAVHEGVLGLSRLASFGKGRLALPVCDVPQTLNAFVSVEGEGIAIENSYDIYVYPAEYLTKPTEENVVVTGDTETMLTALRAGKRVLYFGSRIRQEKSLEGTYCTDFWCYPMFASISKSMGRPLPVGTLGLCMDKDHPAFGQFPTDGYTTPQWWKIVTGARLAVLDGQKISPLVWMIDNFDRNHKLGLIYEAKVGEGRLLVSQTDLSAQDSPEAGWLFKSLLSYASSDAFAPKQTLDAEWLAESYE